MLRADRQITPATDGILLAKAPASDRNPGGAEVEAPPGLKNCPSWARTRTFLIQNVAGPEEMRDQRSAAPRLHAGGAVGPAMPQSRRRFGFGFGDDERRDTGAAGR
jgi:hypothetical protein